MVAPLHSVLKVNLHVRSEVMCVKQHLYSLFHVVYNVFQHVIFPPPPPITCLSCTLSLSLFISLDGKRDERSAELMDKDNSSQAEVHPFSALDYVIFSSMLVVSTATGLYHAFSGGGQKTTAKCVTAE